MQVNRKDELVASFQKLLESWKTREREIITREEQARREQERKILDTASTYTSDAIIRDLTELQMQFTRSLETLASTVAREDERMNEVNRAIEIETRRIEELRNIRTAAEAIDILRQEQGSGNPHFRGDQQSGT